MKNSLCWPAVAFGVLLTLNSARAVIDFDPAPDPGQSTPAPQPPSVPSTPPPASTTPAPTAPPPINAPPHVAPFETPTNSAAPAHTPDERRFFFFSKLKLSDDQKTQMEQIMSSDQDWKEKRRQMMDLLTVSQKIQLKTMVDGWRTRHPSGSPNSASTQE